VTPPVGEKSLRERLRDVEAMLDAVTDHAIIQLDLAGRSKVVQRLGGGFG